MIKRLRAKHTQADLERIYARPHEHHHWQDHILRVAKTLEIAQGIPYVKSAADLSAGDAYVIKGLNLSQTFIGDFAPKYEITGAIEKTIDQIPVVDLFILSETLEHLDDPLAVLKQIRAKTRTLLLSTPHAKWDDINEEHYWAWDRSGILKLLTQAGFEEVRYDLLELEHDYYYDYQIWVAE